MFSDMVRPPASVSERLSVTSRSRRPAHVRPRHDTRSQAGEQALLPLNDGTVRPALRRQGERALGLVETTELHQGERATEQGVGVIRTLGQDRVVLVERSLGALLHERERGKADVVLEGVRIGH